MSPCPPWCEADYSGGVSRPSAARERMAILDSLAIAADEIGSAEWSG